MGEGRTIGLCDGLSPLGTVGDLTDELAFRSALPKPPNSPPGRSLLPPQELSTKAKERRRRERKPSRRIDRSVAILLVVDDEAEGG